MKQLDDKELKEIIQSAHINLLIGAGCSTPFIKSLGDIEKDMNNENTKEKAQRDYYKLIKKSKSILNPSHLEDSERKNLEKVKKTYDDFLRFWIDTISKRSLHIVNKQVNIFTTNFDMFIEDSCERLGIPYNDGFAGQINREFGVENFNKIQKYKSMQFDNTSDIPIFNIIKLHGSISWQTMNDEKITYSYGSHIDDNLEELDYEGFEEGYKTISIINPNAEKHFESVLDINYSSMLRKFTLELEKENSILIIIGFSLADKHINKLLYSVMKSNPTLIVVFFSHSQYSVVDDKLDEKKYPNFYIISPDNPRSPTTPRKFEDTTTYLSSIFPDNSTSTKHDNTEQ